jgi:hypothetical protein
MLLPEVDGMWNNCQRSEKRDSDYGLYWVLEF